MKITLQKYNESLIKIEAELSILKEIGDYFTFFVPGAQYMPLYRIKAWDGKIRLFDFKTCTLPYGLLWKLKKFTENSGYELITNDLDIENSFSNIEANDFFKALQPTSKGKEIYPREDQIYAFRSAIQRKRIILISPTGSGKSLIIYAIIRWLVFQKKKVLLVVPSTSLVEQMYSDFEDYSLINKWKVSKHCHRVYSGKKLESDASVVISTWQSIYKLGKSWFSQFDAIIGDEAHGFQAKSLSLIMKKLENAEYRIGTTATLQESKIHKLVLEGWFGPAREVIKTKELIDLKAIADVSISCLILKYPKEECKFVKSLKYHEEIEYIAQNQKRMNFLKNLALSLDGNTLIMFKLVDKHGKQIYKELLEKSKNKIPIFFVHGKIDVENREEVRKIVENQEKSIIVASSGVFSQGVNIQRIHNIILASPMKSIIRNKQSIGRGTRLGHDKTVVNIYDIVDNFEYNNNKNFALEHFFERLKIYNGEKFVVKTYNIAL
jgi:superfamily II DNA or RNA helicase